MRTERRAGRWVSEDGEARGSAGIIGRPGGYVYRKTGVSIEMLSPVGFFGKEAILMEDMNASKAGRDCR